MPRGAGAPTTGTLKLAVSPAVALDRVRPQVACDIRPNASLKAAGSDP